MTLRLPAFLLFLLILIAFYILWVENGGPSRPHQGLFLQGPDLIGEYNETIAPGSFDSTGGVEDLGSSTF